MKILVVGAGAIGSLFGAMLSKKNDVILLGRSRHVDAINRNGLCVTGKTRMRIRIAAVDSADRISMIPDVILLTVKSYDTEIAIKEVQPLINNKTTVISLQNGLENIEKIAQVISTRQVLAGVTTHGVIFSKPGEIIHTGKGNTLLGAPTRDAARRVVGMVRLFNDAGIKTHASRHILRELWRKAIINSSINPITAFLQCKNGYLLKNAILEHLVEKVCEESTRVAQQNGITITPEDMIRRTKKVIRETAENYSSMAQSIQQGKRTEIETINGSFVRFGKHHRVQTPLNSMLLELILSITSEEQSK
ncbi:MAG TPA: 2-dehydropantoate 2-reductase [Candidatus Thermoplasmatota archaeon]|nr:2-dehydropantoate 2-reductase [Candidatus Thermoplasmatota archaeon]